MTAIDLSPRKVIRWKSGDRTESIATPTPFGPERVDAMMKATRELNGPFPWSDVVPDVMTDGEIAYVNAVWDTMPGHTCWADAFFMIRNGRVAPE